ncbi:MAG: class I SAM-dependent RNA methyltransferase [Treponemataceae bacterium]|nr:class I SAM-dependent RNA methyltransferase [Spirochaetales bacterium]MDY6031621.1 class I SAM-dependent RNA methyltransferase [Treponemataceae bacterium]
MNHLVALCAIGAEKVLANEIKFLGYKTTGNAPGRVFFDADDAGLFRTNLCLRTADRVYLQMASFHADDFDQLYDGVNSIAWQDFLKKDSRVVVDKVRTFKSKLSSEHAIQTMTLKSIYTKLQDVWHMSIMPESGEKSDVRIHIDQNQVSVLLDLSGEPLHKRGYRTDGGLAPMRETTACVLLQMMLWRRKTPLHDPFCGSGTIATEATLYAYDVAPGFGRHFALENLAIFNRKQADEIRCKEAEKIRPDAVVRITGTDIDPEAVRRSQLNAEHACVMAGRALQMIGSDQRLVRPDFDVADFKDIKAPYEQGLLLGNPPYGERLGDAAEAEALYGDMASLFSDFPGWQMGFITSNENFEKCIGKKAESIKNLKSGNLDTKFYIYR